MNERRTTPLPVPESQTNHEAEQQASYETVQKGFADIVGTTPWSRSRVNTLGASILNSASSTREELRHYDGWTHSLDDKLEEYTKAFQTQRGQELRATGYLSHEDGACEDEQTGLKLMVKPGDIRNAAWYRDTLVPTFSFVAHEGESDFDAMARWAKQFLPEEEVDHSVEDIQSKMAALKQEQESEKPGSSFLYYHTRPFLRLQKGENDVAMVEIGVDYMKNYDGEPTQLRHEGLRVTATPQMLAELNGMLERKKALVSPFDAEPEMVGPDELRTIAVNIQRELQEARLDAPQYITPAFEALTRQDFINASLLLPRDGEAREDITKERISEIVDIVSDVEALNNAYDAVDTEAAEYAEFHKTTYNYEHQQGRKWDHETVTQYGVSRNGKAMAIRQKPDAPQEWAPVLSRHEFAPEHQQRAGELILKLANKKLRQETVAKAQQIIYDTEHSQKAA